MSKIFAKEMKQYFRSPVGYIYLGAFLAITGYYFTMYNLLEQTNDIREYFTTMIFTLLFFIPILTMRLFAEEKRLRTDQLLFTLPVRLTSVVLGKFLAAYVVFLMGIALTLPFLPVLLHYGTLDGAVVFGCYIGIMLAAAAFIAIGLFISSITENQVIAAIITYSVLFLLYLVSLLSGYLQSGFLKTIFSSIAIFTRYQNFTVGLFDISTAVYYVSIAGYFLFVTIAKLSDTTHQ